MEPYEKIFVSKAFLDTDHGRIACSACHGGDPASDDWQTAHKGLVKNPAAADPSSTCGECHPEITATAVNSLHATIAPIGQSIRNRTGPAAEPVRAAMAEADRKHCSQCHADCGQCHVSRPDYVHGGLLAGHQFQKTPPMETTCASCHGGRVFGEFTGRNAPVPADTHYDDAEMGCMDCHEAAQMHADATGVVNRFASPQRPRCRNCHPEAAEGKDAETHRTHRDRVACQVCHAGPVKQCFGCHVGTDSKGLAYFKCKQTRLDFKIGRNPDPTPDRPYAYVVVRHPPIVPGTFDYYAKDALKRFDAVPTWKLDAPHSIQRRTPQNTACNNCHGNRRLFLSEKDLAPWEIRANTGVVVPDAAVPPPVENAGSTN